MIMSEPKETTKMVRAGLERACKEFTARIAQLGFRRTKKMIWTRRHSFTVDFIHFHRCGGTYGAPINFSVDIRVHFGIRVLNDDFPALALNGPSSDAARIQAGRYHLRFNAQTVSTYDRCIDDLVRLVTEQGEPWFREFHSVEDLLQKPHCPLWVADKQLLAAAASGNMNAVNLAASLKLLGIK
jgi:hypothetical protein